MRIGVISDTHGLLRPEAEASLAGVEAILHAGDVGAPEVLERLSRIAPVTAVRGNVDAGPWAEALPERVEVVLAGFRVLMVHDVADAPANAEADILVFGHSHRPIVERTGRLLRLNPGSAGPRRFRLPVTLARLELGRKPPTAEIAALVA